MSAGEKPKLTVAERIAAGTFGEKKKPFSAARQTRDEKKELQEMLRDDPEQRSFVKERLAQLEEAPQDLTQQMTR